MRSSRYAHLALLRRRVGVIVPFLLAFGMSATASAAPGTGATVFNPPTECFTFEIGTSCINNQFVSNETITPSGQTAIMTSIRSRTTFTGAGALSGCSSAGSFAERHHALLFADESKVSIGRFRAHSTSNCSGEDIDCVFTSDVHFAGGQVQYSRSELECTVSS